MPGSNLKCIGKPPLFALLTLFFMLGACVGEIFDFDNFSDRISIRPTFLLPAAHGRLTLGNLLEPDDSLIFFGPDNSIRIVIRDDSLFHLTGNDFIDMPLPESVNTFLEAGPVPLDDFEASAAISLDDLISAEGMPPSMASLIREMDGSDGIFPEIPVIDYLGTFPGGHLEDIEYAYFTGGQVELSVRNNLPVQVTLVVRVVSEPYKSTVAAFIFPWLNPGHESSQSATLAGVMVTENMSIETYSFSTPGSGGGQVNIDLEAGLEIDLFVRDPLAGRGRAVVPPTVLAAGSAILDMNYEDDQDIEMLTLKEGWANYYLGNDSKGLNLKIDMPNLGRNGGIAGFDNTTDGAGGYKRGSVDLSGAVFDYSQYHHQLFVEYTLSYGAGTGMTEFDFSSGGAWFNMTFRDFAPASATGYFGQKEHVFDDEDFDLDFDLFDKISGDFRFTNPSLTLFYRNSAGVPVNFVFNLDASSSDGTRQESLLDEAHPGFEFEYPVEPGQVVTGDILLNRDNSNIVEFIALPPSNIMVKGRGKPNPGGQTGIPNFLDTESEFLMGIEIELPLELLLTNLVLTDTVDVDLDAEDIDMIGSLVIMLEVTNGFPLGVSMDMTLYDSIADRALHTFSDILLAEAAPVNEDGIFIPGNEVRSEAELEISGATVDHFKQATHFIMAARLNTGKYNDEQIPVKLLTTCSLEFRIKVRAELNIN